jgi:hypothetical protein
MLASRCAGTTLALALLAAGGAGAFQADGGPDYRGSFTLGAGMAHGVLGVNAEAGRGHWAGYFGLGFASLLPAAGVSAGARWFLFEGSGLVASLGLGYVLIEDPSWSRGALADWATGPVASARVGWRVRLGMFTAELGAGPAVVRRAPAGAAARWGGGLDVDFALGFEL